MKIAIIFQIAYRNLRKQKFQTGILLALLCITSITLFFCGYLNLSMKGGLKETKERLGADLIIVPERFVSRIEDSLFLGKPCTVNFEKEWLDKTAKVEGIEKVSFQLYIASLSQDCCENSLQLIAFDKNTDFVVTPWLSQNGIRFLNKDEIVLGWNMKRKIGEKITYFGREFSVADVLKETGMGYDNCAFINYETAYEIANDSKYFRILPFKKDEQVISMVLAKVELGKSVNEVKENILKKYGDQGITVYQTSELIKRFSDNLNNFKIYAEVFKFLFLLLATVALYGIYSLTIHLRKSEFGAFISFGTPKKVILSFLVAELLMQIVFATFVGLCFVCPIAINYHEFFKKVFSIPYLMPKGRAIVYIGVETFITNLTVCILASIKSFYELINLEGVLLIKPNNE